MVKKHRFSVLTIFPQIISDYSEQSILGRGQKAGLIDVRAIDLRKFTTDKHHKVDDTPYGGGPGMVLKPEPIFDALDSLGIKSNRQSTKGSNQNLATFGGATAKKASQEPGHARPHVILMDPRGQSFSQKIAQRLSRLPDILLIAGRYEGVDERVREHLVDESISLGPYVLSGGELAALTIIEATARLIPGVLGKQESLKEESFTDGNLEYPQYTKPEDYRGYPVPKVLLSGNHAEIAKWRRAHSKKA